MNGRYKAYPEYREPHAEWVGKIPSHWKMSRNIALFEERDEKNFPDEELLAVTMNFGVLKQAELAELTDRKDTSSDDKTNYKLVKVGDIAYNKMRMWQGAIGLSAYQGIVSPAYVILKPISGSVSKYYYYQYKTPGFISEASRLSYGLCDDMNSLRYKDFRSLYSVTPPFEEQVQIAVFLDHETTKIDRLITKQEELIALLKEKRQAVISHAVTKGLNPDAPMKDSGLEWPTKVPDHWEILQLGKAIQLQRGVDITKDNQSEGDYPVVSSGGISSFHNKYLCEGPGVVIGRKGTAGKVYYITEKYWPHDTTLYVKQFGHSYCRYVFYKMLSMDLESYDTGSANPTLNRNLVHPVLVSWPPIHEQRTISDYLDEITISIDNLIKQSAYTINLLRERRTALISAAVTGKIDVRDWKPMESSASPAEIN